MRAASLLSRLGPWRGLAWVGCVAVAALGACDNLARQPKDKPFTPAVGSKPELHRWPPQQAENSVARDEVFSPVPALTPALLAHGQQRFDIYCSPCHSRLGDGNGMIVQRGFPNPPSFHIDRLRDAPSQHFYDVISNGYGVMYSYADRVAPPDRWAIVAYIRALQDSQHAPPDAVPADQRAALQ